ncbi:hypothetical protein PM082_003423 [Marasmius tenuissimus]|nr:hypothetical protein PM082_003423 [Marasmius tenuissimus]
MAESLCAPGRGKEVLKLQDASSPSFFSPTGCNSPSINQKKGACENSRELRSSDDVCDSRFAASSRTYSFLLFSPDLRLQSIPYTCNADPLLQQQGLVGVCESFCLADHRAHLARSTTCKPKPPESILELVMSS